MHNEKGNSIFAIQSLYSNSLLSKQRENERPINLAIWLINYEKEYIERENMTIYVKANEAEFTMLFLSFIS